jgi:hypothetical protein
VQESLEKRGKRTRQPAVGGQVEKQPRARR